MKTKMFLLFLYMAVLVSLVLNGSFENIIDDSWQDFAKGFYFISGAVLGIGGLLFVTFKPAFNGFNGNEAILSFTSIIFGWGTLFMVFG